MNDTDTITVADKHNRKLHDLRVSVTDRCNFRCEYCMPKDVFGRGYRFLPKDKLLRYEEIEKLVRVFVQLGVRKVRLTGGEPLLREDLEALIARLAGIKNLTDLAITTNASLLTQARTASIKRAGIRRVNISLDALDEKIYRSINQINSSLGDILRGIEFALAAGFESVKINMVVQKGVNENEIIGMANRFRGSGAIVRFIEFMDVGNHNQWSLERVFTAREIIARIQTEHELEPLDANYHGEVAKRWRYVDGGGEIGVISSISQPFCGGCARARLSAVGELYTCLFATAGFDLRALLRSGITDNELAEKIAALWQNRSDQYSAQRAANPSIQVAAPLQTGTTQKVEMSYIGG